MQAILLFIEPVVMLLAGWTLAYHLTLVARWPAGWVLVPAVLLWMLGAACLAQRWRGMWGAARRRGPAWAVLGMGLALSGWGLVYGQPDIDDYALAHRALYQAAHLDEPFAVGDTKHDVAGLPAISPLHLSTSHEMLFCLMGRALHIDPLWCYQHVPGLIAGLVFVAAMFLSLRSLGLKAGTAALGVALLLVWLLFEGEPGRNYGVLVLGKLSTTKAIARAVVTPLILWMTMHYLSRPGWGRWALLCMGCVAGAGQSNAVNFLGPVTIFVVSAAWLICHRLRWRSWPRVLAVNLAGWYGVMLVGLVMSGVLPAPNDLSVWEEFGADVWWKNLGMLWPTPTVAARNVVLLVVLPWVVLRPSKARLVTLVVILMGVIFFNPATGPTWLEKLTTSAYWRLLYVLPVMVGVGLMAGLPGAIIRQVQRRQMRRAVVSCLVGVLVLGLCVAAFGRYTIRGNCIKPIGDLKLPTAEQRLARVARPHLEGRRLLADEDVVVTLGLMVPSVRVEVARPAETLHLMLNSGRAEEGRRRVLAQQALGKDPSPQALEALRYSLDHTVDRVVLRRQRYERIAQVFTQSARRWAIIELPGAQRFVVLGTDE
jgi:hypothetical protein